MTEKSIIKLDIDFPGIIPSDTYKVLVVEIIKQLMYQRDQIPLPIDQLKFSLRNTNPEKANLGLTPRRAGQVNELSISTDEQPRTQGHIKSQVIQAFESYSSLFCHIADTFNKADICEVAVLLGPTIVSPRELYHIQWSASNCCHRHELPNLTIRKCMNLLFKEMVCNSCLWSTKSIPVTNTTVFLKLNAVSSANKFLEPVLAFNPLRSVPKRVVIKLNTICTECTSNSENCNEIMFLEAERTLLANANCVEPENPVWVKVNPSLKGLKDTAFKK